MSRDRLWPGRGLIPAHAGKTSSTTDGTTRAEAHPRSRGENAPVATQTPSTGGSSPLTRGKPSVRRRSPCARGLIPAHAGKTRLLAPKMSTQTAHPRSRGENCDGFVGCHGGGGSSPLTRGKHEIGRSRELRQRLIPAHAGKTQRAPRSDLAGRAHPRSRGENTCNLGIASQSIGSSPLTRGKRTKQRA